MFVVLQLNKEVAVSVMGQEINVPLSYAVGMIGALPVFSTKESAELFAGDNHIVEITEKNTTDARGIYD